MRAHLTYSNVAATMALALAVGGGSAYAADLAARNSVGSGQIVNGAVRTKDLKPNVLPKSITVATPPQRGVLPQDGGRNGLREVSELSFFAPRDGTAVITVETSFNGKDNSLYVVGEIDINGEDFRYRGFDMDTGDVDGYYDQRQTASFVVPIERGNRKITTKLIEASGVGPDANSEYFDLTTTVEYISGRTGDVEPPPADSPAIEKQRTAAAS